MSLARGHEPPRRRCSSSGSRASRTSATSTCCSPTRPAHSPTATSASIEQSTPRAPQVAAILTLGLVCNEATQTGDTAVGGNPLDVAIWEAPAAAASQAGEFRRVAIAPFDHDRRCVSVLAEHDSQILRPPGGPRSNLRPLHQRSRRSTPSARHRVQSWQPSGGNRQPGSSELDHAHRPRAARSCPARVPGASTSRSPRLGAPRSLARRALASRSRSSRATIPPAAETVRREPGGRPAWTLNWHRPRLPGRHAAHPRGERGHHLRPK